MDLKIEDLEVIARNDKWEFAVGRNGDRWLGVAMEGQFSREVKSAFASQGLSVHPVYTHIFSEVSEGCELGMQDKTVAMLLVGAMAQCNSYGFGGIKEWLVQEELRGKPEDFTCEKCGDVGCDGTACCDDCGPDFYSEDEGECE